MKNKMVILAIVFSIMMVFAGANSADAYCNTYGKVVYTYQSTGYAYIYIAVRTTLPTYGYYYYTNNQGLISTLASAMSGNYTVYISGSSSSCPTSGTWRYGGTIYNIRVYRNL